MFVGTALDHDGRPSTDSKPLLKPYVPAEIGSQLAKASLRLIHLEQQVESLSSAVKGTKELEGYARHLEAHARFLEGRIHELEALGAECERVQRVVQAIQGSRGWRYLCLCYRMRDRLLPQGSTRRRFVGHMARILKKGLRSVRPRLVEHLPAWNGPIDAPLKTELPTADEPTSEPLAHEVSIVRRPTTGPYADWIRAFEPGATELAEQRSPQFRYAPRLRLLVSADEAGERLLQRTIDSLVAQTYDDWELCIATAQRRFVERARIESRIRLIESLSGCMGGEYVAFLDAGDALAPFALFEIVAALNAEPAADLLYSDEDTLTEDGERSAPHFKPDWSPDTLRSHHYVGQLAVFRRALLERVGGLDAHGAYDRVLRASEQAKQIVHVPKVLCHRNPKDEDANTARRALRDHVSRLGLAGEVCDGLRPGTYQVRYPLPSRPLISILIPSKDHADMLVHCCIDSIQRSSYANWEVVIMENGSTRPETFSCYRALERQANIRVCTWTKPFNYAAINNEAARHARGEVLLFLNNDIQALHSDWLERMLEHAMRPQVGAVGAKLYYPDDTIQHAGAMVGARHGPSHCFLFAPRDSAGYGNRLVVTQNLSLVTGACLMTRRSVFAEVGGFDEQFAIAFNDVDLCLKMRARGYLVVWTPHAELYHFESVTRGYNVKKPKWEYEAAEAEALARRWKDRLPPVDPYFNPNLSVERLDGTLNI